MSSSNSSSSNNPDPQETSYVEMSRPANNDPFLVGSHCQMDYCNQLDFLPFKCQSCLKVFCLDHRSEDSHKCESRGAWAERKRLAAASKASIGGGRQVRDRVHIPKGTCASPTCTTEIGTALVPGVHCDLCQQNYCLKHRLREEHDCAAAIEARRKTRPGAQALQGVESALDTFRARWKAFAEEARAKAEKSKGSSSLFKRRPNPAVERMKRMNELKSKAKGDAKLPADKRVYLTVAATETNAKGQVPKEMFFYSKDWVVGRMLDAAAKAFQIENLNNRTSDGDNKLHVFYVEGERFLGVSEKIGEALQSGQRVILTRGGSPPDSVIAMLLSV